MAGLRIPVSVNNAPLVDALPGGWAGLLVVFVLVTSLWWPALWHGKLMLNGDAGLGALPMLWLHGDALAGRESLLWSSRIYGGHPLFAEGQGGFANPLTIFSVWLCGPLYAQGFVHWLNMLVGGAGVFSLCRILGISRWSSIFATISVLFSDYFLSSQQNLPISSSLAWLPWLLAATEYWLKQPSLLRASLLAIPAAFLVFSGYPQVPYGAALFALVSLLVQPLNPECRDVFFRQWRMLLVTGLIAVMLAVGLSAVQFFPLLELAGQSHREQDTKLIYDGVVSLKDFPMYLTYLYFGGVDPQDSVALNSASMLVLLLAGLLLFFRVSARINGYVFGIILLFNLAMGSASPIFRLCYAYHLIPGLHYFRNMFTLMAPALVGFSVIAACMLDALSGASLPPLRSFLQRNAIGLRLALAVYGICLLYVGFVYRGPLFLKLGIAAPLLMVAAFFLLDRFDRRNWLPLFIVLILAIDVLALRIHTFAFHDKGVISQPAEVRAIATEPDVQDYHVMEQSLEGMPAFIGPTDPAFVPAYRKALKALSPFPMAMLWKVPSINGVVALWLARRDLLNPAFTAEIEGNANTPTGLRLIDILGIRYLSRDMALNNPGRNTPGLSLYAHDPEQGLFIYRNHFAKPRFQVYWDARVVDTTAQALAGLQAAQSETLFIEKIRGETPALPMECKGCAASKPAIEVVEAKAMRYRVNVEMPRDGWLFLADANYPGWEATVNGLKQPVYSAQVLGKAVRLQAGRNQVTIRYVPWSFYIGAALTSLTLVLVLFILLWHPVRQFMGRSAGKK